MQENHGPGKGAPKNSKKDDILPKQGLDIKTTKSLGLKLVNFLASHQLRAKLDINTDNGTEFAFRFDERGRNK